MIYFDRKDGHSGLAMNRRLNSQMRSRAANVTDADHVVGQTAPGEAFQPPTDADQLWTVCTEANGKKSKLRSEPFATPAEMPPTTP